jgi:hypothetical protein
MNVQLHAIHSIIIVLLLLLLYDLFFLLFTIDIFLVTEYLSTDLCIVQLHLQAGLYPWA